MEDVWQSLAAECDLGKVLPSGLADLDRRLLAAAAEDTRRLLEAVRRWTGRSIRPQTSALHSLLKFPDDLVRTKYRGLKGILFRHGAQSLIRHLKKVHAPTITASIAAQKELAYFQKRISAMRYGEFRKRGLYIASGHAEAACRTDVARRCKQAGMHWRHHHAVCISAILATLRSGTFVP